MAHAEECCTRTGVDGLGTGVRWVTALEEVRFIMVLIADPQILSGTVGFDALGFTVSRSEDSIEDQPEDQCRRKRQVNDTDPRWELMKDSSGDSDFQKWMDFATQSARRIVGEVEGAPCLRISNQRYAKDATLEDRLTLEDRDMLKEMGIAV